MATTGLQPAAANHPPYPGRTSINGGEDAYEPVSHRGVPRTSAWNRSRRLSRWHRPYATALVLIDALAVTLATATVLEIFPSGWIKVNFSDDLGAFYIVAWVVLPLGWLAALWGHGTYDRRYLGVGTDEFKRVVRASVTVTATVCFFAFTLRKGADLSRISVASALIAGLLFVLLLRFVARRVLHFVRGRGRASHRMLLVGTLSEALEVHTAVTRTRHAGMVPVAIHLTDGRAPQTRRPTPVPV
ncbi:MAG TPA: sugar transferase, partial [Micromonosporaceae bacterium]|nr:sugar transferase [Micromonosporaceae bacterium]